MTWKLLVNLDLSCLNSWSDLTVLSVSLRGEWSRAEGHRLAAAALSGDQQWGRTLRTLKHHFHPSCWQLRNVPQSEHIHTPQTDNWQWDWKPDEELKSIFIIGLSHRQDTLTRKVCATAVIFLSFLYVNFSDIVICECENRLFVVEVTGRGTCEELKVLIHDGTSFCLKTL